jgi:hypothetical protein
VRIASPGDEYTESDGTLYVSACSAEEAEAGNAHITTGVLEVSGAVSMQSAAGCAISDISGALRLPELEAIVQRNDAHTTDFACLRQQQLQLWSCLFAGSGKFKIDFARQCQNRMSSSCTR